ncbi:uncharacterized protein [Leptinotarsa decemlineata]|uniref:uncharacterized protein n=1 Tax=Leptinotarsa decemlineata TaxID=7539 RepID=UPI003D30B9D0
MGAKISPILAAYVMDDLLDIVLEVLPYKPFSLKKYVDDIIISIPREFLDETLSIFNSYDPYIQFTLEKENEGNSVPFLETLFIRSPNNVIYIDWYRKPMSSGRYINY